MMFFIRAKWQKSHEIGCHFIAGVKGSNGKVPFRNDSVRRRVETSNSNHQHPEKLQNLSSRTAKDSRVEPLNLVGTRSTAAPRYRTDLGRGGTSLPASGGGSWGGGFRRASLRIFGISEQPFHR